MNILENVRITMEGLDFHRLQLPIWIIPNFCLNALKFLGSELKNSENALNFILFYQTKLGGFARIPDAATFLDSTFYAVKSLGILLSK